MNNIKVEVESPENASTSRKRQHETEPQTPREEKKMTLDEQYEKLIKIKLKFVEKNKGEIPALHFAARVSDVDVCRRLVEQGADVNEKYGVRGATPLHYAAMNASHGEGLIDYFLEKGCDIDVEDAHYDKAINLNFAKFLYNNKRCEILSKRPSHFSMLDTACKFGDLEMCKWLLEEVKIDVNKFNEVNWKDQVLDQVAHNLKNEAKEAEELFKRVADTKIKIEGNSLLHHCFSKTVLTLDAAKFVHEKDGDLINEINEDGATILHLAARFAGVDVCQWLVDQGQDINAVNKQSFANFLHYAAQNRFFGDSIIQEFGHNLRGIVNQIDENVYTPLHYAILNERHVEVAEVLLELGADLSVKRKGNNFLHFCIVLGKLECAKFVHAKDKNQIKEKGEGGKTTLHLAADNFNEEICAWLVRDEGADPQEITVGGKSVLESTSSEEAKKGLESLITTKK
ncbi:putative ankyrin repeat protein RF_0381 [Cloeon dipterum]|uniref:putative ankyrin repeat protein RF_0381 n=1 Tax=Cloeon dipterum TaxID=197152 RepID=UPI003220546E